MKINLNIFDNFEYSRTRIKETRIKETFGYKKRFHSSDFMQFKRSTLIGQLIKETLFSPPNEFLLSEFDCILDNTQSLSNAVK